MTVKYLREIPEIKGTQVLCETSGFCLFIVSEKLWGRTTINSGAVVGELT